MNDFALPNCNSLQLWHAANTNDAEGPIEKRCWKWLNESEKDRLTQFKVISNHNQHLIGRAMMRWLLSPDKSRLSEVLFDTEAQGKPFVKHPASSKRPFNLSHTDGLVLCAIGSLSHHHVGVDVERSDRSTSPELAERYFSPPEITLLQQTTDEQIKRERFLRIWTLKEAFIKAIGTGLRTPLSHFAFKDIESANPTIDFLEPNLDGQLEWHFHCFEPRKGFIASTATACSPPSKRPSLVSRNFESEVGI